MRTYDDALSEINKKIQIYLKKDKNPSILNQAKIYALTSGGRRFRPCIVLLTAAGLEKRVFPIKAALALEFLHTASLIADDLPCMDDDVERRARPSLHKKYGEAIAVLTSYGLIAEAYQFLSSEKKELLKFFPEEEALNRILEAIHTISSSIGFKGAVFGQFLDLYPEQFSLEAIQEVSHLKTGEFFCSAFLLGWILGGGERNRLKEVRELARRFGFIFQLVDDLEDYEEDLKRDHKINQAIAIGKNKTFALIEEESEIFIQDLKKIFFDTEPLTSLLGQILPALQR